jgi:hemin uptake protein HemP
LQGSQTGPGRIGRQPETAGPAGEPDVRVRSAELLCGRQEIRIEHAGEVYRLRVTGKGKLILTK